MKIQYKLWLLLSAVFIITSFTLFIVLSNNFKQHLQSGYETIALNQGNRVLKEVKDTYPDSPIRSVGYLRIANQEFDGRIIMLDQNKRVFADSFSQLKEDTVLELDILKTEIKTGSLFYQTDEYGYVQYTLISFEEQETKGYLLLIEDVNQLSNELKALQNWMIRALILALFLFFFISYFVSTWFSKPIKQIISRLKGITPQKRQFSLKYKRRDEIKELIDAIHNMVEELNLYDVRQRQFISTSSHELKTPLTTMHLILENLPYVRENEDTYKEYVQDLSYEVDKMKTMVEQLLQINRLWDKKLEKESITSSEMKEHLIQSFQYLLQEKNINLEFKLDSVGFKVDRTLFLQGIDNLVSNGIRYSNQNGTVLIILKSNKLNNNIDISIHDQGIGISSNDLSHVFEPFYRSNDATAWNSEGSGLGLFIVKKMIELHKGSIMIESEPNIGTEVRLTIPM
jgi:signal transduction histidine kinase